MAHALDRHAEKAYAELEDERQRRICEQIFKALTDKGTDARGIRRPTTLATLCAIADAGQADVTNIINVFRKPSRSFLMPPLPEVLDLDTTIDISHESLMRVWERLKVWSESEAQSREIYLRIANAAERHQKGEAALLRDPELQIALNWWERTKPNETWASRYHAALGSTRAFLDKSVEVRDAARRWAAPEERELYLWGPLAERYAADRPRKMLSIDGGGLPSGLLALEVIGRMEGLLRQHFGRADLVLADYFDYVAGTGTGGVIAACLARGVEVEKIRQLYVGDLCRFNRASILERFNFRYRSEPVARALQAFLGSAIDLFPPNLRCLLLVVVGNAINNRAWPITSNPLAKYNDPRRIDSNLRIPLWTLARARTAARTFFLPEVVRLDPSDDRKKFVLEDGSLTPYFNPAFLLYRMATQAPYRLGWLSGEKNLLLLSVGTGARPESGQNDDDPVKRNLIAQLTRMGSTNAARLEQDLTVPNGRPLYVWWRARSGGRRPDSTVSDDGATHSAGARPGSRLSLRALRRGTGPIRPGGAGIDRHRSRRTSVGQCGGDTDVYTHRRGSGRAGLDWTSSKGSSRAAEPKFTSPDTRRCGPSGTTRPPPANTTCAGFVRGSAMASVRRQTPRPAPASAYGETRSPDRSAKRTSPLTNCSVPPGSR